MRIKIKENQYITLTEAVGVPSNIVNISKQVYDNIISILKPNIDVWDFLDNEIILKGNFTINDYNFSSIELEFKLDDINDYRTNDSVNMLVLGMTHRGTVEMMKTFDYVTNTERKNIKLFINLSVRNILTTKELIDSLKTERAVIVSSLSHELMHAYDNIKRRLVKTSNRVTYSIGQEKGFANIQPLNDFISYMYFAHITENLVRSTEIYTLLDELGVSKKEFYNFLTNTEVYKKYKRGYELTYEQLRKELLTDIPNIKKVFDNNNIVYSKNDSDDKIVDICLSEFFRVMKIWKGHSMEKFLTQNMYEEMFGFGGDKKKFFEKYLNKVNKFGDDYVGFFKYEISKLNHICFKMMKKLSKLYSLINNENPQQ